MLKKDLEKAYDELLIRCENLEQERSEMRIALKMWEEAEEERLQELSAAIVELNALRAAKRCYEWQHGVGDDQG